MMLSGAMSLCGFWRSRRALSLKEGVRPRSSLFDTGCTFQIGFLSDARAFERKHVRGSGFGVGISSEWKQVDRRVHLPERKLQCKLEWKHLISVPSCQ